MESVGSVSIVRQNPFHSVKLHDVPLSQQRWAWLKVEPISVSSKLSPVPRTRCALVICAKQEFLHCVI